MSKLIETVIYLVIYPPRVLTISENIARCAAIRANEPDSKQKLHSHWLSLENLVIG